jgi:hypothetical protein
MATETSLFRMADKMLNGRLREFVLQARLDGKGWRDIAADLRRRGADVSHETLRSWFPDDAVDERPSGDRAVAS